MQQCYSLIDSFESCHRRKPGEWVNEEAANDFQKLVKVRETQSRQLGSVDEQAIIIDVLSNKPVRRLPKSMSLSRELRKRLACLRRKRLKIQASIQKMNVSLETRFPGEFVPLTNLEDVDNEVFKQNMEHMIPFLQTKDPGEFVFPENLEGDDHREEE